MKILITGGAGYIGSELVTQLNNIEGIESIVVYDNLSRGDLSFFFGAKQLTNVTFVHGDILDSHKLDKEMSKVDTVVHLAAFVSQPFNHLQNLKYEQINRWGTLGVVRAVQNNSSVKRVFYLSSASVYGFREDISIADIPAPENGYAKSKLEGEAYIKLLEGSHEVKILRAANVFGFNSSFGKEGVLNAFMFDAIVHGEIKIFGNGEQQRPFVALNNLTQQIGKWVKGEKINQTIAVQFNASMNEIKDWLVNQIPELSYQYLNQNQKFPTQAINLEHANDMNIVLAKVFDEFKKSIRIRS